MGYQDWTVVQMEDIQHLEGVADFDFSLAPRARQTCEDLGIVFLAKHRAEQNIAISSKKFGKGKFGCEGEVGDRKNDVLGEQSGLAHVKLACSAWTESQSRPQPSTSFLQSCTCRQTTFIHEQHCIELEVPKIGYTRLQSDQQLAQEQ